MLAGTDRLDRPLTIGQMQGKFQPVLLPQVREAHSCLGLLWRNAWCAACQASRAEQLLAWSGSGLCMGSRVNKPAGSPGARTPALSLPASARKLHLLHSMHVPHTQLRPHPGAGGACCARGRAGPHRRRHCHFHSPLPVRGSAEGQHCGLPSKQLYDAAQRKLRSSHIANLQPCPLQLTPCRRIGEPPLQVPRPAAGVPRVLPVPIGPAFALPDQRPPQ